MAAELTLGAEEELHLIDLESRKLSAKAPQVLSRLPAENFSAEIQRTTVETNTDVVTSLDGLREELLRLRREVIEVASADGTGIAAVGTAPRSAFADFELTSTGRYGRMQEQYRVLVDEQLICGTQIHVGVSDRELAVQIAGRLSRDLPVLLALSSSSPFWNGLDTGYASIRTIIWQRWPSAGATGPMESAAAYDTLLADLIRSGVIADAKMAYFDVRPSSHAPTLELRVCDACPIVDDAVLIAGLFRAAVRAAELDIEAGVPYEASAPPIHRAAMWQAARSGLTGNLLTAEPHPRPVSAARAVRQLVQRLRPQLEELGDYEQVRSLAEAVLARGSSADRQRAAFAERSNLDDVMDLVVAETQGPASGPAATPAVVPGYRSRAGDEAIGPGARARTPYRDIVTFYRGLSKTDLAARLDHQNTLVQDAGITFRVDGDERPFDVDLLPRVINHHDWEHLTSGLRQRARALEAFLEDVYTDQRILEHGTIAPHLITQSTAWRPEARRLPHGTVRAPVMGFDLVRNEFGQWRILEDNVRTPSGAAYALAARKLVDTVVPDLPRSGDLVDPEQSIPLLSAALLAHSRPDGVAALVTNGPENSAWFEHKTLAERAGLLLVTADDLGVRDGRVIHLTDGTQIDSLYLRVETELVDLVSTDGDPIGARLMDVAAEGRVFLANAPGNGIADDKAMYSFVPDLIAYYLNERPILESVPTYRPSDEAEQRIVLERVGELVTKPVDARMEDSVLIGPAAMAAQIVARRAAIAENPHAWVAQEVVAVSSHPTLNGSRLEPRRVDLRAFAYVRGTGEKDVDIAGFALTRVAPEGSLVVDSSRGSGAKDTWILAGDGHP